MSEEIDFDNMSLRQLRKWVDNNEGHEDYDYALEVLTDLEHEAAEEAAYERDTFGEPEDSPCLDDPWWKHP